MRLMRGMFASRADRINPVLASTTLPEPVPDSERLAMRSSKYGDQVMQMIGSGRYALADEGSYFVANNATIGTGIAINNTAFAANKAAFLFGNTSSNIRIYPDYIKLICTAASGGTLLNWAVYVDYQSLEPSTKTALTPVNVNGDSAIGSVCRALSYTSGSILSLPALTTSARVCGRGTIQTYGQVRVGDEYVIRFGDDGRLSGSPGLTAARSSAVPCRSVATCPPVCIGVGQWASVNMWLVTNSATFEYQLGWWER